MGKEEISVRLMKEEDFDAIVRIDEKVLKTNRSDDYRMKFDKLFRSNDSGQFFWPVFISGDGRHRHERLLNVWNENPVFRPI